MKNLLRRNGRVVVPPSRAQWPIPIAHHGLLYMRYLADESQVMIRVGGDGTGEIGGKGGRTFDVTHGPSGMRMRVYDFNKKINVTESFDDDEHAWALAIKVLQAMEDEWLEFTHNFRFPSGTMMGKVNDARLKEFIAWKKRKGTADTHIPLVLQKTYGRTQ